MGKAGLTRLKIGLAAASLVWLAACAGEQPPKPAPAPPLPPPPVARAAPSAPKPPPPTPDQCGANQMQGLVGHSKAEIPVPLEPRLRRVVCTTCPMTRDFVPNRQTVLFDASTGLITSIRCG